MYYFKTGTRLKNAEVAEEQDYQIYCFEISKSCVQRVNFLPPSISQNVFKS